MVRHDFIFVAATPILDFLNTEVMAEGQPADLLGSGEELLAWLLESGLATRREWQELEEAPPAKRAVFWKTSIALRASLRRLFVHVADGHPIRSADLRVLDDTLAGATGHLRLKSRDHQQSVTFEPDKIDPAFLLAHAAARFISDADLALVKRCAGSGCILFFYDTTKSHTRRWCSMGSCGNRSKVRAHYERKVKPAEGPL